MTENLTRAAFVSVGVGVDVYAEGMMAWAFPVRATLQRSVNWTLGFRKFGARSVVNWLNTIKHCRMIWSGKDIWEWESRPDGAPL